MVIQIGLLRNYGTPLSYVTEKVKDLVGSSSCLGGLSALKESFNLFYCSKFWVHFPRTVIGEPYMMTYHLYTPYFIYRYSMPSSVRYVVSQELSCHLVAPNYETGM